MIRELSTNSKTEQVEFDCQVFHHSQLFFKECLGQLWPTSVTFFPKVTVVERIHYIFARHHKTENRFPRHLRIPPIIGPKHILFYKDGKRLFSLVEEHVDYGWFQNHTRWNVCHPTIHDEENFESLEEAMKEIEETINQLEKC